MSSFSTLSSKYFNKLNVNKLVANTAVVNDLSVLNQLNPQNPSYLYSLLLTSATLNKTTTGGTLTFIKSEVDSVIEFTDRPFRKTNNNYSIDYFIDLFYVVGNNTFSDDPPNGVLVTENGQKTYELLTAGSNVSGTNYTIELKLIDSETHSNLQDETGRMSFFVDGSQIAMAPVRNADPVRRSVGRVLALDSSDQSFSLEQSGAIAELVEPIL